MWNQGRKHGLALAILFTVAFGGVINAAAAEKAKARRSDSRPVPAYLDFGKIKFEIVSAKFVSEYQGATNRYQAQQPDTYRAVVVTLRISKPAGQQLTFSVPDISLHYYFGNESDVLSCSGVSGFSTEKNTDRPMVLLENDYGRTSTGLATTEANTVYVDVFFQNLEPNTNDLYVFLGRPAAPAFKTNGWKQN